MKKVYIQPQVDTTNLAAVSILCGSPIGLGKGMVIPDEYEVVGD